MNSLEENFNMKTKRLLIIACILSLLLCLFACSEENNNNETDNKLVSDTEEQTEGKHVHSPAPSVKEKVVSATCFEKGTYQSVIYCSECKAEISRSNKKSAKLNHKYVNNVCEYCGLDKNTSSSSGNSSNLNGFSDNPSEGLKFTSNGNGTCYVSGLGSCEDYYIVIPQTSPNGDTVVGIGEGAFYNAFIGGVLMPNTVTYVGEGGFSDCLNLKKIVFSDNLSFLGNGAFMACVSLEFNEYKGIGYLGSKNNPYLILKEVLDKSKTEYEINPNTRFISSHGFDNCRNLIQLTVPDSVISIGSDCFQLCESLTYVTLSKNLKSIEGLTFSNCAKLESVTMFEGITSINLGAFQGCSALKLIKLPSTLKTIGESAFYYCSSLTEIVVPRGVTQIERAAFSNCGKLEKIVLPDDLEKISSSLISRCTSLKTFVIPETVKEIGKFAFQGCSALESITIPKSVTAIESDVFHQCRNLTAISFDDPDGWRYYQGIHDTEGTAFDLSNPADNVKNLGSTYYLCRWRKIG